MMKNIKSQYSQNERDVILSSMTEGVLAVDRNRKLIMINKLTRNILFLPNADFVFF